ncbi:MAG: HDOD domain-containing protein [bacterium]|nr:HDOD domain-containing protein [bacterium]
MKKDYKTKNKDTEVDKVFVARQPIFDRNSNIFAYELLFRSGFDNFCNNLDGDYTSSKTLANSFILLGIDSITSGKRAFINFTENLLVSGIASIFPKEQMTIEILENIEPNEQILQACKNLKQKGYIIALDDFVLKKTLEPLIKFADIIKVDLRLNSVSDQQEILSRYDTGRIKFLAEKVETREEYDRAFEMGYSYFQGYFFSKPVILEGKDVQGYKIHYLWIIQEVNKHDVNFDYLEEVIKQDVSLAYKLLRFINSAAFGLPSKIHSIKQALTFLGTDELKKWISLIALSSMGDDKPEELFLASIIRAQFCEQIARLAGLHEQSSDLFLMGMFSMIDAFMDKPIASILKDLPIAKPVKEALLGKKNRYRAIYELILAYERGNWQRYSKFATLLKIEEKIVPEIFSNSVLWATNSLHR